MGIILVVKQPFSKYNVGDRITDSATIQTVLTKHPTRVVKINGTPTNATPATASPAKS